MNTSQTLLGTWKAYCTDCWVSPVKMGLESFPGGSVVKNPTANSGDRGSIPGPGRSHMPRATQPVCHNYWACALDPMSRNCWDPSTLELCSATRKALQGEGCTTQWGRSPHLPQLERSLHSSEDPTQPKRNKIIYKKKKRWGLRTSWWIPWWCCCRSNQWADSQGLPWSQRARAHPHCLCAAQQAPLVATA